MTKADIVKRIIPLIKDEEELRKFAEIGLPYCCDMPQLLDMYEQLLMRKKDFKDVKE